MKPSKVQIDNKKAPRPEPKVRPKPASLVEPKTLVTPNKRAKKRRKKAKWLSNVTPRAQALLELLAERWPHIFPKEDQAPRPWATDIHQQIVAALPASASVVKKALHLWQIIHSEAYLRALAAGGPRYDLEGRPVGTVSSTAQTWAQEQLAKLVSPAPSSIPGKGPTVQ